MQRVGEALGLVLDDRFHISLRTQLFPASVAARRPTATAPGPVLVDSQWIAGAGRDRNHDDRLEDGEIEQRQVTCGDELVGDVAVHDASEAAALADIAVITGALIIDDTALDELALPRLVQVRGGIEVKSNAALAHVALPALQSVDGPLAPIDLCNATKGRLWIQPSGAVTVQIEDGMIAHAQCFTSLDGASYAM